jgi:hypothetical protein
MPPEAKVSYLAATQQERTRWLRPSSLIARPQSPRAYLRYLRRERRQSPRAEAAADHVKVKTEMLQLRLMEKRKELVRRADVDALIDGIAGVT